MTLDEIRSLIEAGESETLELKKPTGQLSRAGETLCAFLNGRGGLVLLGVTPAGRIEGQTISDKTLRDVAATIDRLEPATRIGIERIAVEGGREVLVLRAEASSENVPGGNRAGEHARERHAAG